MHRRGRLTAARVSPPHPGLQRPVMPGWERRWKRDWLGAISSSLALASAHSDLR
jgi:hypothetical protein